MKFNGKERRKGKSDRRSKNNWVQWVILVVLLFSAAAGGYFGRGAVPPNVLATSDTALARKIDDVQTEQIRLAALAPDTVLKYIVHTVIERDTLVITKTVASPPKVIEIEKIVTLFDTVTIYAEPQIIRIPAPERSFWSSETYKPSIGNTVWGLGSFLLGVVVGGQVNNDARACVIINGEEICEYR